MQYVRKYEYNDTRLRMRLYFEGRFVAIFEANFDVKGVVHNVGCDVLDEQYCSLMTLSHAMNHFTQMLLRFLLGKREQFVGMFPTSDDLLL